MLIAVFISIGVLITGVVLLSLKSSAKAATDPYTVSAQPRDSMRLRPQHLRTGSRSAGAARSPEDAEAGAAGRTPSKGDFYDDDEAAYRPGARLTRGGSSNSQNKDDVLWEVGSASDVSDDEDAGGASGPAAADGDHRKGLGGGGANVRGERRGLLAGDMDDEEAPNSADRAGTASDPLPREVVRNPFADEGDEAFGDYEGIAREEADEASSTAARR